MNNRKCYLLDVDGTLLFQPENFEETMSSDYVYPLPKAAEKTMQWHCEGHTIVLTTGRPESMRELTRRQLSNAGIVYDILVMGLGSGERILVNDYPGLSPKAFAYNVKRNVDGLENIP